MGYQPSYKAIDWDQPRTDVEWQELADQLRGKGAQHRQDAHDSFERCDTDGALSQWASGLSGAANELAADIAEDYGWIEVQALFTADGQFLTTDIRESANYGWGHYWAVPKATAQALGIKPFVNVSKAKDPVRRAKAYAAKGFTVGTIRIRPYVTMAGGSITSVTPVAQPSRRHLDAGDFEIVRTRHGDLFDSRAPRSDEWYWWTPEELAAKLGEDLG